MDIDQCIIFVKGLKPVKANKFYYFKHPMAKEMARCEISHNDIGEIDRGTWRKYNPYNPYVEEKDEKAVDNLNIESLDDLFEDVPNDTKTHKTQEKISGDKKLIENTNEMDNLIDNNVQSNNTSEIDSVILPQGNDDNDEELFTIDVQKEIEAKFDELFGDITENNNTNKN